MALSPSQQLAQFQQEGAGAPLPADIQLGPMTTETRPDDVDDIGFRRGDAVTAKDPGHADLPPVPLPSMEDNTVTLPGGFVDPDGRLLTTATVRELTGADEEALARPANANLIRYIDTLVHRCLVDIGGVKLTDDQIDDLLIGDRDMIALAIRRVTYGDVIRLNDVTCPNIECKHKFDVNYSLTDDVPVKGLKDPEQHTRTVKLRKGEAVVSLITGGMQKKVFADDGEERNDAELNTLLLRWAVQRIDGMPVMRVEQVLDMGAADRRTLLNYLDGNQPGPRYGEVKQECPKCEREFPFVIGLPVLFQLVD